jgi:VIT1/CCC1 family predicted Fe2+/Mn2+ transporter
LRYYQPTPPLASVLAIPLESHSDKSEIIIMPNGDQVPETAEAATKALAPTKAGVDEETGTGDVITTTTMDDHHPLASTEHLGKSRQYWRDIILGVNDGIVSTFLLVTGVAGGGLTSQNILLTAIAGAIAGAVSMFAGEFVATKSQNEVLRREIRLEQAHVQKYQQDEMKELGGLLDLIGIPEGDEYDQLRQQLLRYYEHNSDALLKVMVALEFGVIEEELRSPGWAGTTSLTSYVIGALPSVLPFAFAKHAKDGLIAAAVMTFFALIIVGMVKTWATRGNCFKAAGENVMIATIGAGIAYGVGVFFQHIVN